MGAMQFKLQIQKKQGNNRCVSTIHHRHVNQESSRLRCIIGQKGKRKKIKDKKSQNQLRQKNIIV